MRPLILAMVEAVVLLAGVSSITTLWLASTMGDAHQFVLDAFLQAAVLAVCCIVSFYYHDLYDLDVVHDFEAFVVRLVQSIGVAFILVAFSYMAFPDAKMTNGPFLSSVLVIVGLLVPLRVTTYAIMRSRALADRLLIVGSSPLACKLIQEIKQRPNCRMSVVGIVGDHGISDRLNLDVPVLGPLEGIASIVAETQPDRIIVALSERRGRLPVSDLLEARANGIPVDDGVDVYERLTGKVALESLMPSNLIFAHDFQKSRFDLLIGRVISMLVAVIGLVISAPVMVLVTAAIKLDSTGSIFFVQPRIGFRGRPFNLIKFRTMQTTRGNRSEWARDNEDRITRVGRWLRALHLDELPQFINVLRGDMNLVGPRPHPVTNAALFRTRIPYYSLRCSVRPGVTGWAQVRYGYANNLDEEIEKMRYDLFYIKRMSLALDVRVLFDSVKSMVAGREAESAGIYNDEIVRAG